MFFSICQILKTNAREINKRMGVVQKGKGGRIEKVDWEQGGNGGVGQTFFPYCCCDLWPTKLTRWREGEGRRRGWEVPFTCATWSCPCHRRHQQRSLPFARRNF